MKKKPQLPPPFAALTKDQRFEGTFEVLVPVEGRVRPRRVPLQFPSQENAQDWIQSREGKETIAQIMKESRA